METEEAVPDRRRLDELDERKSPDERRFKAMGKSLFDQSPSLWAVDADRFCAPGKAVCGTLRRHPSSCGEFGHTVGNPSRVFVDCSYEASRSRFAAVRTAFVALSRLGDFRRKS